VWSRSVRRLASVIEICPSISWCDWDLSLMLLCSPAMGEVVCVQPGQGVCPRLFCAARPWCCLVLWVCVWTARPWLMLSLCCWLLACIWWCWLVFLHVVAVVCVHRIIVDASSSFFSLRVVSYRLIRVLCCDCWLWLVRDDCRWCLVGYVMFSVVNFVAGSPCLLWFLWCPTLCSKGVLCVIIPSPE
jgi:hypothetical protein